MQDREKLIALLCEANNLVTDACLEATDILTYAQQKAMYADHLIANGVTVRERGRWIQDTPFACVCSVCNHERYGLANDSGDNFCPNCGADMRGAEDGK